jgi:hypothetical protein
MLMRPHDGRIDKEMARQGAISALETLPEPTPDPASFPAAKAVVHRIPVPKLRGKIAPGDARAGQIQDRFDKQPITERWRAASAGFQGGKDGGHLGPSFVSQQQTDRHQVSLLRKDKIIKDIQRIYVLIVNSSTRPSTARRKYVGGSLRRITWKNNVSPRAKLAR